MSKMLLREQLRKVSQILDIGWIPSTMDPDAKPGDVSTSMPMAGRLDVQLAAFGLFSSCLARLYDWPDGQPASSYSPELEDSDRG